MQSAQLDFLKCGFHFNRYNRSDNCENFTEVLGTVKKRARTCSIPATLIFVIPRIVRVLFHKIVGVAGVDPKLLVSCNGCETAVFH